MTVHTGTRTMSFYGVAANNHDVAEHARGDAGRQALVSYIKSIRVRKVSETNRWKRIVLRYQILALSN
jgi:hypothetical protein